MNSWRKSWILPWHRV